MRGEHRTERSAQFESGPAQAKQTPTPSARKPLSIINQFLGLWAALSSRKSLTTATHRSTRSGVSGQLGLRDQINISRSRDPQIQAPTYLTVYTRLASSSYLYTHTRTTEHPSSWPRAQTNSRRKSTILFFDTIRILLPSYHPHHRSSKSKYLESTSIHQDQRGLAAETTPTVQSLQVRSSTYPVEGSKAL